MKKNDSTALCQTKMIVSVLSFLLIFFLVVITPSTAFSQADKRAARKQPAPPPKEIVINDTNLISTSKRADELLKKGGLDASLALYIKIYDYTNQVLNIVKFLSPQYEKLLNDDATSRTDKEDFYIKQKRMLQLTPRYKAVKETVTYNIGYIYAKKGDNDKAIKYLTEVIETSPFSHKQDSLWMKSKNILLGVYGLEGEF